MSESEVLFAERKSRARAMLFYLMAVVLVGNTLIRFLPLAPDPDPASPRIVLGFWLVMVVLTLINLMPVRGWRQPARLQSLLNDEATREYRRNSFAAGFWAAIACAATLTIVASLRPVSSVDVAQLIITAALATALTSFATQELRAARG